MSKEKNKSLNKSLNVRLDSEEANIFWLMAKTRSDLKMIGMDPIVIEQIMMNVTFSNNYEEAINVLNEARTSFELAPIKIIK